MNIRLTSTEEAHGRASIESLGDASQKEGILRYEAVEMFKRETKGKWPGNTVQNGWTCWFEEPNIGISRGFLKLIYDS